MTDARVERLLVVVAATAVAASALAACRDPQTDPPPIPAHNTSTISVDKIGNGTGSIRTLPAGINCGASCTGMSWDFVDERAIDVIVSPSRDALFAGLACSSDRGDAARVDPSDVPAGADARTPLATIVDVDGADTAVAWSCTAEFTQLHTLQIVRSGTGTGVVRGSLSAAAGAAEPLRIDCGADCDSGYFVDEVETLTATPDPGSHFDGWRICASGTDAISLTMSEDRNCEAVFTLD